MNQPANETIVPRALRVAAAGSWNGAADDSILLDFEGRHRRRIRMTAIAGTEFLLDLPQVVALRHGDVLMLEDGRKIEVVASPEPLTEIRAQTPQALTRLAWHIGNRHLAVQIMPRALRIRADRVIDEMLAGLGARLLPIEAPFDPEGGAYAETEAAAHSAHEHHAHHDHGHHGHPHDHASHDHSGHDHAKHDHGHHGHNHHDHDHDASTCDDPSHHH
ncbi:MAG: urease accessory protein UreE [Hyphomicrobiales bacterium]|nr:urease accessory protein UreE [Hyphomicrobiales bacterium]MDE2114246.1 urease accessory protein UreE [Hyphomicrobiales bacterium]